MTQESERDRTKVTVNPTMGPDPLNQYTYIAVWDVDNHGACYPDKVERILTFGSFLARKALCK